MFKGLHRPSGMQPTIASRVGGFALFAVVLLVAGPFAVPRFASAGSPAGSTGTIRTNRTPSDEECTIAVITGAATVDGRPLFWKNRDTAQKHNEIVYFDDGDYPYVTLADLADSVNAWLGVNETGFAIMNALSHNLTDSLEVGVTNGELMKLALRTCGSVADFELLLFDTVQIGLQNPSNLAVIDASGCAAIYETEHSRFTKYDVTDPLVAPDGFLVRTNFSLIADTSGVSTWRYNRANGLIGAAAATGGVDVTTLLDAARDLVSDSLDPYPLPYDGAPPADPGAYGFINTLETINRSKSAAFGVIRGILPDEDPLLSTFYAGLGQPVLSIVLPVWVGVGQTPPILDGELGSPLSDLAFDRYRSCYNHQMFTHWLNTFFLTHGDGTDGYLLRVEEIEAWLIPEIETHLQDWYEHGFDDSVAAIVEYDLAEAAFAEYQVPISPPAGIGELAPGSVLALTCWPNPMREEALLQIHGPAGDPGGAAIEIYDVSGRIVRRLTREAGDRSNRNLTASRSRATYLWDRRGHDGRVIAPGVYYLRTTGSARSSSGTVIVLP